MLRSEAVNSRCKSRYADRRMLIAIERILTSTSPELKSNAIKWAAAWADVKRCDLTVWDDIGSFLFAELKFIGPWTRRMKPQYFRPKIQNVYIFLVSRIMRRNMPGDCNVFID